MPTLRARRQLTPLQSSASNRPRRAAANQISPTTIERSSPDGVRTSSIRLTVKADPRKLKEATSGSSEPRRHISLNSRDTFVGGDIVTGPRNTRKKAIVEESSEEEEDEEADFDDDAEGEEEEEDAEGEEDEDMEDDEDASGEEDAEMQDAPSSSRPLPPLPVPKRRDVLKPHVTLTPANQLPSVEDKEMAMDDDDDDEELSSLDEDEELEMGDELGGVEGELSDEEDSEADFNEGSATPDLSKLTRRQRADPTELMALSNEAQKKKHLTAEEISMRRVEMARRRKNLSEKRNEEEKMDTINRLLKKQAPKRRRKAEGEDEDGEEGGPRPNKVYTRYVQTPRGAVMGVPVEWVEAGYLGGVFGKDGVKKATGKWSGRMVEVVD